MLLHALGMVRNLLHVNAFLGNKVVARFLGYFQTFNWESRSHDHKSRIIRRLEVSRLVKVI